MKRSTQLERSTRLYELADALEDPATATSDELEQVYFEVLEFLQHIVDIPQELRDAARRHEHAATGAVYSPRAGGGNAPWF